MVFDHQMGNTSLFCQSVPEGDWFCPDCRPKQRSNSLPSRQHSSIDEEEEDEVEEQEEEDESEEEESEEEGGEIARYDGTFFSCFS